MQKVTKICSKCKEEKNICEFGKDKHNKDGYYGWCKFCRKQKYDEKHKEKRLLREEKREKLLEQQKQNRKDKQKIYYYSKKGKISHGKYNSSKKGKLTRQNYEHSFWGRKCRNEYWKRRRKNDISYHLRNNFSTLICTTLRSQNFSKRGSSILKYLPYTMQELKEHLEKQFESWMTWENYGRYKKSGERKWHIDHIIPQSKLPYDSMEHPNFQKCWALENLRPLEAIENIKKRDKIVIPIN